VSTSESAISRHFTGVVASVYGDGMLLIAMYGRFAKPSKKATLQTLANSHRVNIRIGNFAGRKKGIERQR